MLERVLEPEVMDTAEEARDYDAMDHVVVNTRFCEDLLALGPLPPEVLDVGTGTARIPIELCTMAKGFTIVAIDLADHMLDIARANAKHAGVADRVRLEKVDAKALPYADGAFGATISNSIIHHIPEPKRVLDEMWRVTAPGGRIFVRDLTRPPSDEEVERLMTLHGGSPPDEADARDSYFRARASFRASFCASLTIDEVAKLVAPLGIPSNAIRMTSDRHWTLSFEKPK
jgi:ubiquinone/menaquinone biosynthesis C-methylase UbiE